MSSHLSHYLKTKIKEQIKIEDGELVITILDILPGNKAEVQLALYGVDSGELLTEIETIVVNKGDQLHLKDLQEAFRIEI